MVCFPGHSHIWKQYTQQQANHAVEDRFSRERLCCDQIVSRPESCGFAAALQGRSTVRRKLDARRSARAVGRPRLQADLESPAGQTYCDFRRLTTRHWLAEQLLIERACSKRRSHRANRLQRAIRKLVESLWQHPARRHELDGHEHSTCHGCSTEIEP